MTTIDPIATYARSSPGHPALVELAADRRWTYAELDAAVDRLAAWLVGEFGRSSGARVATLSKNCAEMLLLQFASVRAGTVFVPYNWRLAAAEVEVLAADSAPVLLFHEPEFAAPAAAARSLAISEMPGLGEAGARPPPDARRPFDAVATILYTSGTSGTPKGVMLSEENTFWSCANFIYGNEVTIHSVFLCDMPLFHVAGLHAASRAALQAGATVLLSRGFDTAASLARLSDAELGITHYFSVPQMAAWLWNEPGFDPARLTGIVCWAIGGAPNPRANAERFVRAGIRIGDGFGMSETGSAFGMPTHDSRVLLEKAGSCGLPFVSVEARIVGDDGRDLPAAEVGELWLRGPSITQGYWNKPDVNEQVFRDGWFRTGDAAMRDEDGYYFIVDRKKDMFISGGENVYPAEVEAAIAELADIAECAVIGVPDERWGEVGRVYVVPVPGRTVQAAEVLDYCRRRLARYKVPKTAVVTDSLPRTASGKLQKHLLQERARRELGVG